MHHLRIYIVALLFTVLIPFVAIAQINQDYFKANQLYRQQNFQEAFELFEQLHSENPANFIFLEKATESLMQLKKYDQAISLIEGAEQLEALQPEADIQLGEIFHVRGEVEKADSLWNRILQEYPQNRQVHLEIGRAMKERRAYDQAIDVYEQLLSETSSSTLIISELADIYLQDGHYDQAIRAFLQLLREDPNQISYVQNRLVRFQNEKIYDIAIGEIDDLLNTLSLNHPAYQQLQQMQVWLLMERRLFDKALTTAQQFEKQTSQINYLLYNLGEKLLAEQEFELAEQTYLFYIENEVGEIKFRSMEDLADVYRSRARYLEQHNLSLSPLHTKLYQKASDTYEQLYSQAPDYKRLDKVLTALAELALDRLHQPKRAQQYLKDLQQLADTSLVAQQEYLQGRLFLYHREYNSARRAFTESNKQAEGGNLKEKTRYYLALTDFYSGDYEFAKIQLQALERESTSFYANDAVQLRLWIQNGLKADSTGKDLEPLAQASEYFTLGKPQLGINELKPIVEDNFSHPLAAEALLELNTHKKVIHAGYAYRKISQYLSTAGRSSPLHERLLWERARLADQFVTTDQLPEELAVQKDSGSAALNGEELPQNTDQLIPLYEEILMHYPNGFYATYVRERLQELQTPQT